MSCSRSAFVDSLMKNTADMGGLWCHADNGAAVARLSVASFVLKQTKLFVLSAWWRPKYIIRHHVKSLYHSKMYFSYSFFTWMFELQLCKVWKKMFFFTPIFWKDDHSWNLQVSQRNFNQERNQLNSNALIDSLLGSDPVYLMNI